MELLTDKDSYQFVENNVRFGLCQSPIRYSKANNSYMNESDSSKIRESIFYLPYKWADVYLIKTLNGIKTNGQLEKLVFPKQETVLDNLIIDGE